MNHSKCELEVENKGNSYFANTIISSSSFINFIFAKMIEESPKTAGGCVSEPIQADLGSITGSSTSSRKRNDVTAHKPLPI